MIILIYPEVKPPTMHPKPAIESARVRVGFLPQ